MANIQLASFGTFLTPPLASTRLTGHWPLFSRHPPLASIPSRCCSVNPWWTRPICEPSSFPQHSRSGFFARLAQSAYQVGWFRRIEGHTRRAPRLGCAARGPASHTELSKIIRTVATYRVYDKFARLLRVSPELDPLLMSPEPAEPARNPLVQPLVWRGTLRCDGKALVDVRLDPRWSWTIVECVTGEYPHRIDETWSED